MLSFLYTLAVKPLELIFEIIYVIAYRVTDSHGLTLICLSLAVNLLALPLYMKADEIQAREREKEKKLAPWTKHIKTHFDGDERFMMLQAFYRENDYSPLNSLNSALPLLLQVPFFIAAYHFLSNLSLLKGASFFILGDLGNADGLLTLGGTAINVLPIIMTVINIVSAVVYAGNTSLKDQIQLYVMALVFLILLYPSPSGLVFYWILNNVFSLVKNLVMVMRTKGQESVKKAA